MDRQPFTSLDDIVRLERRPYREVVPVGMTFDILRRSARLYAERPALTFLETGEPSGSARTSGQTHRLAPVPCGPPDGDSRSG